MTEPMYEVDEETMEGMRFLVDRGLLAPVSEVGDEENVFYGITDEGLRTLYMLGMVMATGASLDEIESGEQRTEVRSVAECATALVQALDGLTEQEAA